MFDFNIFMPNHHPYLPFPKGSRPRPSQKIRGEVCSITQRTEPKINRRRQRKAMNAAMRKWKRINGIKGRLPATQYVFFKNFWMSLTKNETF